MFLTKGESFDEVPRSSFLVFAGLSFSPSGAEPSYDDKEVYLVI